jgi:hypothetical protein
MDEMSGTEMDLDRPTIRDGWVVADPPNVDRRLRIVQEYVDKRSHADMSKFLGIPSKNRWNSPLNGEPLSKQLAFIIKEKIPEITLDWLWYGDRAGLTNRTIRLLDEAEKRLIRAGELRA